MIKIWLISRSLFKLQLVAEKWKWRLPLTREAEGPHCWTKAKKNWFTVYKLPCTQHDANHFWRKCWHSKSVFPDLQHANHQKPLKCTCIHLQRSLKRIRNRTNPSSCSCLSSVWFMKLWDKLLLFSSFFLPSQSPSQKPYL
jgi:hypothetical protein